MQPDCLCLIVPVHNEADVLRRSLPAMLAVVRSAVPACDVRLLAVDDGSTDDSLAVLAELAGSDPAIDFASFTRNFGKEAAIHAGLTLGIERTAAEVFVVLDADLQHPPELVAAMLGHWRDGYLLVEAIKRDRGRESRFRRLSALLFYRIFSYLSRIPVRGATDFKLLDRTVVLELLALAERTRFFRGMVGWLGHPAASVPFDVPARDGGQSGWNLRSLTRYAWRNLTAFSSVPLELVTWFGAAGLVAGIVLAAKALFDKWSGHALSGFSTVILLQIWFGSLILLSLGVIGSYIARIYDEIKHRPHYVLRPRRELAAGCDRQSTDVCDPAVTLAAADRARAGGGDAHEPGAQRMHREALRKSPGRDGLGQGEGVRHE